MDSSSSLAFNALIAAVSGSVADIEVIFLANFQRRETAESKSSMLRVYVRCQGKLNIL